MINILTSKPLGFRLIYKITILFFLLTSANLSAENVVPELIFLDHLLKNNPDVIEHIDPDELAKSNRLDISYANEPIKFLINYNIPDEVKDGIIKYEKQFQADVIPLEDNYSVLKFFYPETKFSVQFYFKDFKCIAPVTYFTRNYTRDTSDFFEYYISNPLSFNNYSKQALDEFVASMIDIMLITDSDKQHLANNKIIYVLCDNDKEITDIIGQAARGIYLVANDAIVSTYNTHYHEVAHLLMNYKIKKDIKLAHPLFLEGFATAFGGRGGLSTLTLLPVAQYSINTGFVNIKSLLSLKDFASEDASITYPVAGLYTLDFFVTRGFEEYYKTYLKFSGDYDYINSIDSSNTALPFYTEFLSETSNIIPNVIKIDVDKSVFTEKVIDQPDFKIFVKDEDCLIYLKNNLLLKTPGESFDYVSKIFTEKFPGQKYLTYHYLIEADSERIGIYDLFSNNLLYSYNKGFDMQQRAVPMEDDYFVFSIPHRLLGEQLTNYEFKIIE